MIDLKDLRANAQRYRKGAADKGVDVDIDALLAVDQRLRQAMTQQQDLAAEKNRIGKEIGQIAGKLKKASDDEKAELNQRMQTLQARPNEIKQEEAQVSDEIDQLTAQRDERWARVPQPADDEVPVGRTAADNVEISRWNPQWFDPNTSFEANRGFEPRSHIDLGQELGLIDFQRGVKMAGARSYVLTGDGMRLHNAVLQLAFNSMTAEHGFTPVSVPVVVREPMMVGTGFFPEGRDQVYDIANPTTEEGLVLTGTGEVGLMGFHQGEILDHERLPLCYTTISTCFRREAGAAGKDTAGLYRIHQFDKVEQVVICEADEQLSRDWHAKMLGFVETLMQRLELPYRRLQCCTADLGTKNADMIDIEAWMPGRAEPGKTAANDASGDPSGGYGETHSASRLYDYQTRRLNMRYRDPNDPKGKQTRFCHSLNNTVLASPRILIPILEMYQNADGSITIPEVLRPYMGGQQRIEA